MDKKIIATYYEGHKVRIGVAEVNVKTINSDYSKNVEKLDPRYDLRDHSQDGFEWGYVGSGPSQLAIALCSHVLSVWGNQSNGDEIATTVYHEYSRRVISKIKEPRFILYPEDILDEINAILKERNLSAVSV